VSLLSTIKDVCSVVGIQLPTSAFAALASNRTMQEMTALATEMAERIAYDTREWSNLKLTQVYSGDGVTIGWPLPANFKRMLKTANIWRSTSALHPMRFIPDTDDWMQRRALNRFSAWGEWTMLGGQLLLWPALGTGVTASFAYLDKNCVNLAGGGVGDRFVADNDSFRLDERLLKLGMIWQWKAQKGSPYAEDMGTFGDALQNAMGADTPSPILIGRAPSSFDTRIAYPWNAPTSGPLP
jgi:hypothetical protein